YPGITVDPDTLHVHDGRFITSAGITAGIDLALSLVEEDHGAATARTIAQEMVVFMHRPGGQSQFAGHRTPPIVTNPIVQKAMAVFKAEPHGNHSLGTLADRKSTRLNSSHVSISYAVFCLKNKNTDLPTPYHYTT